MDDERIRALAAEVLADLRPSTLPAAPASGAGLEARVDALEKQVRAVIEQVGAAPRAAVPGVASAAAVVVSAHVHPSLQLLPVPGGGERCVMEPDRPCVQSGMCRTFGH